MSFDSSCDIRMGGSQFGFISMEDWIHPALNHWFGLMAVVFWSWGYFLSTFWAF